MYSRINYTICTSSAEHSNTVADMSTNIEQIRISGLYFPIINPLESIFEAGAINSIFSITLLLQTFLNFIVVCADLPLYLKAIDQNYIRWPMFST